jgi:hypothetical protein
MELAWKRAADAGLVIFGIPALRRLRYARPQPRASARRRLKIALRSMGFAK